MSQYDAWPLMMTSGGLWLLLLSANHVHGRLIWLTAIVLARPAGQLVLLSAGATLSH